VKRANKKTDHTQEHKLKWKPRLDAARSAQSSRVVSATHAARSFSELLDRVCYRGESFVIERGGELVCEMVRVKPPHFTGADFLTLVHSLPKPDPRFWSAVKKATKQKLAIPKSSWES
jgi:hypothetical protein